jgi:hypothetical protein
MKKLLIITLLSLPMLAGATWQLETPSRGTPTQGQAVTGYPDKYIAKVVATTRKGALKDNVTQIASDNGWKVIWRVKKPYQVFLQTSISGANFVEVMNELLGHYPLQVTYHFDFVKQGKTMIVAD